MPKKLLLITVLLLLNSSLAAQYLPLPANLIAYDSVDGRKLLFESTANEDFFPLSMHFIDQEKENYCGIASAVMVLNALKIIPPEISVTDNQRIFSINRFLKDPALINIIDRGDLANKGLALSKLSEIFKVYTSAIEAVPANKSSLDLFRKSAIANLSNPDDFIVVNFVRDKINQSGDGHISPLAAYHAGTDSFLVLDVARSKYQSFWVKADMLWEAMQVPRKNQQDFRGYLLIGLKDDTRIYKLP